LKPKLRVALASYAGLGILATLTLDGPFRVLVWLVLSALAIKTWIAVVRERQS